MENLVFVKPIKIPIKKYCFVEMILSSECLKKRSTARLNHQ